MVHLPKPIQTSVICLKCKRFETPGVVFELIYQAIGNLAVVKVVDMVCSLRILNHGILQHSGS